MTQQYTAQTSTQALTLLADRTPLSLITRMVIGGAVLLVTWEARWKSRRKLARLEPHMLRDIGLEPDDARIEANKPFWSGPAWWRM